MEKCECCDYAVADVEDLVEIQIAYNNNITSHWLCTQCAIEVENYITNYLPNTEKQYIEEDENLNELLDDIDRRL